MLRNKLDGPKTLARALSFCLTIFLGASITWSQTGQDVATLKQQAGELIKQSKYTEALPLLEKIVAAEPDNAQMQYYLGFALLAQANVINDEAQQKTLRVRARNAFIKSKSLGNDDAILDGLISSIPPDGSTGGAYSKNVDAHRAMVEAEAFFAQGKMDDALKSYQKALGIDSNIYEAALFSGDVYMHKEDFTNAEVWYQRAIKINPD